MSENILNLNLLVALHKCLYQVGEKDENLNGETRLQILKLLEKARFGGLSEVELDFIESRVPIQKIKSAGKTIKEAMDAGYRLISWYEDPYPLKNISDPPPLLYIKGELPSPEVHPYIAVVGSRRPTSYGREITKKIVLGLGTYNVTVVSGLAYGIDVTAHKAAIASGLTTIAVLGCGINYIYPSEHFSLANDISKNGAVVSEFPWGTPPLPHHFPLRNRIISGLSRGVLVVEALVKSGSLVTARWAGEQAKEIFAVPGSVGQVMSSGPNHLIKKGAHLTESAADIALVLGLKSIATNGDLKKNSGHIDKDDAIKRTLCNLLESGERNLEKLALKTGLPVKDLLPLVTEIDLFNK